MWVGWFYMTDTLIVKHYSVHIIYPPLYTTHHVWFVFLSDDLKTDRAWIAATITQSINCIHPSPSSSYSIWARGNQYASLICFSSFFLLLLDVLFQMNHKMLAVLCSLRPGRGVCRRLGWRHPLCAQRQRWMCSGFGMCWCGWVIGRCERPRVKILRWERDAFIPPTPPPASLSHSCHHSLFLYHLNSLFLFFFFCPSYQPWYTFPACSFAFSPAPFVFLPSFCPQ